MKLGKLITGFVLSTLLAVGVGVGIGSANKEVKAAEAAAKGTVIYLDAGSSGWFKDNAKIAFWDHASSQFDEFTLDSTTGYYKTTLSGAMTTFNMFRGSALNWDNKWNQGGNDTIGSNNLILATGYSDGTMTYTKSNLYTVTLKQKLGSESSSTLKVDYAKSGTTYNLPSKPAYVSNYIFDGWYSAETGGSKITSLSITSNKTAYARYTSHGAWTGTVNLDLKNSGWADASANYAICLMNKTSYESEALDWSNYVMGVAKGEHLVQVSYSVGFEPTHLYIFRYNPSYSQSQWNANKTPTGSSKWGQSDDITYNEMIRVGDTSSEKNPVYAGYPKLHRWSPTSEVMYLNTIKSNDSHNVEYYSTTITLAENQEFKVQIAPYADGDYKSNYSAHSSIADNFSGGSGSNIKAKVAGTYAIYYDNTSETIYITTVAIAEADEWAHYFMDHVGCDATGTKAPTGWSSCATEYASLTDGAKDIVYGATANPSTDAPIVSQAVARYDAAIRSHPTLNRFITDGAGTHHRAINLPYSHIAIFSNNRNSGIVIISIIASIATVAAFAGYFFYKKKKEDK